MKPNKNQQKRFVAYDSDNGEYEFFNTKKEAENWLNEGQEEGIGTDAVKGYNFIAEIKWRSVYHETDNQSNYHKHTDECPKECDEEEWPFDSDFESVGVIKYEEVEYEQAKTNE